MDADESQPIRSYGFRVSPYLIIFIGILIVSTASILIRLAQAEAPSLTIAAYRLFIAAALLAPAILRNHRGEVRGLTGKQWLLVLLSGGFLAIHFATWITSLEYTSVATSAVLVSTTPLWVAILSPVVLRERPSGWVLLGMVVTLVGGSLVALNETCQLGGSGLICPPIEQLFQGSQFLGNLLALLGALGAAGYLMVGRWLRPTLSLMVYIFTVYSTAAVLLVACALFTGQAMAGFSWPIWVCFLALAIGPQLSGHTAFNYGLRFLSATFISISLLGEPIGTSLLALLILHEVPSGLELLGGGILLAGIVIASLGQGKTAQPTQE